jgi:hypothetical protein
VAAVLVEDSLLTPSMDEEEEEEGEGKEEGQEEEGEGGLVAWGAGREGAVFVGTAEEVGGPILFRTHLSRHMYGASYLEIASSGLIERRNGGHSVTRRPCCRRGA